MISQDLTTFLCSPYPQDTADLVQQAILYDELEDLIKQALLFDLTEELTSISQEGPRLAIPQDSSTDSASLALSGMIRSLVKRELSHAEGKKALRLPVEGEPFSNAKRNGAGSLKRSFDSISQVSGFGGMHQSSYGGENRGGENLPFTFETLFPAIARGLRSTK